MLHAIYKVAEELSREADRKPIHLGSIELNGTMGVFRLYKLQPTDTADQTDLRAGFCAER